MGEHDYETSVLTSLGGRIVVISIITAIFVLNFVCFASRDFVLVALPVLASLFVFIIFVLILHDRVGEHLFGEIGFLYVGLAVAYTLMPAMAFLAVDLSHSSGWVSAKLAPLLPAREELGAHLWRHFLFVFCVAAGYLLARGNRVVGPFCGGKAERPQLFTVLMLISFVVFFIVSMNAMSSPVYSYIDHYTRYDHLGWLPRKIISLIVRLKIGFYAVLLYYLFLDYKKYRSILFLVIFFICLHEITYSLGSRIESLIVLTMAVFLYHSYVKTITLRAAVVVGLAVGTLFTGVEVLRSSGFDLRNAQAVVADEGVKPASEFGAVYFTGFHLYSERIANRLPPRPWPMFFFDFFAPVTFGEFTEWNPQYWYSKKYFPDAIVPPETMGPIAESALWGGEFDLMVRGLLNGLFFAFLVRWFVLRRDKWWAAVVYMYCYATCIMTLKYSVFYHLTPIVKTLMPTLILVGLVQKLGSHFEREHHSG